MQRTYQLLTGLVLIVVLKACCFANYPIEGVGFTNITFTDDFWKPRLKTVQKVTIRHCFEQCEIAGKIKNFEIAGKMATGEYQCKFPFDDSDVYKVVEGAAYSLAIMPDKELENYVDTLIDKIIAAQETDGYLMTWRTINPNKPPTDWSGDQRWSDVGAGHELYNVGHMYEAAVAYFQATGKTRLLNAARKNADLICSVFGPGKRTDPPGHQEIEIALVRLYQATGKKQYLKQAEFFLEQRGRGSFGDAKQDHKPVVEQTEAVGHAVRAMYQYAAMADVAVYMDRKDYLKTLKAVWEDVVYRKMYITGGIGCRHDTEAFGDPYDLPNKTAYTETCAAIAHVFFNHRMFLIHGDSKYIDVLERTMYNGALSGVSMSGTHFCYRNPLQADETIYGVKRYPWIDCSCCPTNISRFIPSIGNYFYAQKGSELYINLFADSTAKLEINRSPVHIIQKTLYPWDGKIEIKVSPKKSQKFTVNVRVPGWAQNDPVPGDLYHYADAATNGYSVKLNGKAVKTNLRNGYVRLKRKWKKGDTIVLDLPMDVRRVASNEAIKDNIGNHAIERGPFVYCFESLSHDHSIFDLTLPATDVFIPLLKQDNTDASVWLKAAQEAGNFDAEKYRVIPYFYRDNHQPGDLLVWFKVK